MNSRTPDASESTKQSAERVKIQRRKLVGGLGATLLGTVSASPMANTQYAATSCKSMNASNTNWLDQRCHLPPAPPA